MNDSFASKIKPLAAAVAIGLSTLVLPAAAATVSYDFTVIGAPGAGGSFSFESTAGTPNAFGEVEYVLTGFSFTFGGNTVGLAGLDGDSGWAIFSGSSLSGLEAVGDGASFAFVPGAQGYAPFLVVQSATAGVRSFNLSFGPPGGNSVPTPASAALSLLALAAAAVALRRRG